MYETIAAAALAPLAAFAGAGVSTDALAQQLTQAPATAPATVTVRADADTLRRNETASRSVVTHDELVKYGDRSALDALKRLPGNRLDRQPRWSANLGADYSRAAIEAGASFSYVSGGWTRTSVFQSAYGGPGRDLELYALYKFNPLRSLRFTASNLLAPRRTGSALYADAHGLRESTTTGATYRSWRLQYEQKFQEN